MKRNIFGLVATIAFIFSVMIISGIALSVLEYKHIEAEGIKIRAESEFVIARAQADSIKASVAAQRQDTFQAATWPYIALGCALLFSIITICSVWWAARTQQKFIYAMLAQIGVNAISPSNFAMPSIIVENAPWLPNNTLPDNNVYVFQQNSRPDNTYMIVSQAGK